MLPIEKMSEAMVGCRVLLIDDSKSFQRLTTAMLKKFGVATVTITSSLAEGMCLLKYHNSEKSAAPNFDIVLMDVNLPDGNGIEGCYFISSHANTFNIPVVVISGISNDLTISQAFDAGASDYLKKPLTGALLKNRLGMLMTLKAQLLFGHEDNREVYVANSIN